MKTLILTFCCIFSITVSVTSHGVNPCTPGRVEVLPVFFVPGDGVEPSDDQKNKMMEHLVWSQTRYYELLNERSTFLIADREPIVIRGQMLHQFIVQRSDWGVELYVNKLFNLLNYNRFNCPYVFVIIYMNPDPNSTFPVGGGRPLNAGFNTGGGLVIMSSNSLDTGTRFQSTLQHELGHSFGLPHVNAYGYDMPTNPSIMSYNQAMWTDGFNPSPTPGIFIPEDIRGLALNKLVFPELIFDPDTDIPDFYTIHPNVPTIGIFPIPCQPDYAVKVTSIGDTWGTTAGNMVQGQIRPNGVRTDPLTVTFHAGSMWVSPESDDWIPVDIVFPVPVTLDKIGLHSQHSGFIHPVSAIRIQVLENGNYKTLVDKTVSSADQWFEFEASASDSWRLYFMPGETSIVTIRGLQFYYQDEEVFPPFIPYDHQNPFINQLPSRPEPYMPMNHETFSQMNVDLGWIGLRADKYRLQVDTTIHFCNPIVNKVLLSESFQYTVPEYNKKYYWRVKGLNDVASGSSLWSVIFEFDIDETPSGIKQTTESNITVYPNPSSGTFSITSIDIISEVHILDMLGRKVYSAKPEQTQISYHLKKPGVYLIHLITLNGIRTQKLIIYNK